METQVAEQLRITVPTLGFPEDTGGAIGEVALVFHLHTELELTDLHKVVMIGPGTPIAEIAAELRVAIEQGRTTAAEDRIALPDHAPARHRPRRSVQH